MVFNSLTFFLFLPAVWLVFYVCPDRWRWLVLLVASYGFYAALGIPYLLAVLAGVTLATYYFGQLVYKQKEESRRRKIFWVGVGVNLALLVGLKYLPFLTENSNAVLGLFHSGMAFTVPQLLVAIGVSYFIFQAISYLSDIHLEIIEPEPQFGHFALYMAFFPKLLQGPIERAGDLLPQLKKPYTFDYDNMRSGMLLFAWGLFQKVVIADRLALYVDPVYGDVHAYTGLPLLLATYFYAFQIYFDFAGYTNMALGVGRLFNLRLTQNFNGPYLATSVADFWRRWHITFSRWILDYIFKPLQMNWRHGKNYGTAGALLVTFLACGIWHGASWTFIVWGALHGLYMAVAVFWRPYQKRLHKMLKVDKTWVLRVWQTVVTFHLVCLAWVFFRAQSLSDAWYVAGNLFGELGGLKAFLFRLGAIELATLLGGLLLMVFVGIAQSRKWALSTFPIWVRWPVYVGLVQLLLLLGTDSQRAFLYFQF